MGMGKKKRFWILLVVLLTACVLFVFRDTVMIYAVPKAVLSKAISNSFEQLRTLYMHSPVSMLAKHISDDGRYTAKMSLDTYNAVVGSVTYDMHAQFDFRENRIFTQGTVETSSSALDLSLYFDSHFMALTSNKLLGNQFYGITYESFREDIRSIPLFSMLVGETVFEKWDASVLAIQEAMNKSWKVPQIPEISEQDMKKAITALMLLPSDVERIEISFQGENVDGYKISFHAQGEQVRQGLRSVMETVSEGETSVSVDFYLYEKQIVMVNFLGRSGENIVQCALELMCEPEDTRVIRILQTNGYSETGICIQHTAQMNGGFLNESWKIYPNVEGTGKGNSVAYRWDAVTGDLIFSSNQPIALNLIENNDVLRIQTNQFDQLLSYMSGNPVFSKGKESFCTMVVQPGGDFETPDYKNLNNWSLEDIYVLIESLGAVIDFEIE